MKITSNSNTYEINRHNFSPVLDVNIIPELEWQEGISEHEQYVNVKVDNELSSIVALQGYSGRVYLLDGYLNELQTGY